MFRAGCLSLSYSHSAVIVDLQFFLTDITTFYGGNAVVAHFLTTSRPISSTPSPKNIFSVESDICAKKTACAPEKKPQQVRLKTGNPLT